MTDKETILVTGGAGFIGSHLCKFLLDQKFRVICLDNFDDFYPEEIKQKNIEDLKSNSLFKLVNGDIRNTKLLDIIFTENTISIVIHLAAKAGIRNSFVHPQEYFDVNVNGSVCLLEAMKKNQVQNIIFSSSSSVYGNGNGKQTESDNCDHPISPYGVTKRAVELLLYNYYINSNFNIINLRLFSVYGPNQRPDLVLHKFMDLMIKNKPVEVYGSLDTTRDYTYIADAITAIFASVKMLESNKEKVYEIINIGNDNPINLRQLIETIQKQLNRNDAQIINTESIKGDARNTHANIEKAKRILKYQPSVCIENGVNLFYEWYAQTHDLP